MIKILIAEDSPSSSQLLISMVSSDSQLAVVGVARDGKEALSMARKLKPDLILMDMNMPEMDGIEASEQIMSENPTPIIVISASQNIHSTQISALAFKAGALAIIEKPPGPASPQHVGAREHLIAAIKAIAAVKPTNTKAASSSKKGAIKSPSETIELVAIATSVGGPAALQTILGDLPADYPLPILVVQHIAPGFVDGLVSWLQSQTKLQVELAVDGSSMSPGHVYVAPDEFHLTVNKNRIKLNKQPPIKGFRPSANCLYSSIGSEFGKRAVAVVLTGMGDDGVEGLKSLRKDGGFIIAQDEASSIVFGMNGAAVAAGLVDVVLPINQIAAHLRKLL